MKKSLKLKEIKSILEVKQALRGTSEHANKDIMDYTIMGKHRAIIGLRKYLRKEGPSLKIKGIAFIIAILIFIASKVLR